MREKRETRILPQMLTLDKLKIQYPFNRPQTSSLVGASKSSTMTFSRWLIVEILFPQSGYSNLLFDLWPVDSAFG